LFIKLDHGAVNGDLVFSIHVHEGFEDLTVHSGDGFGDAFAHVALLITITQFDGFMGTG
jgi:hypothetical protein